MLDGYYSASDRYRLGIGLIKSREKEGGGKIQKSRTLDGLIIAISRMAKCKDIQISFDGRKFCISWLCRA